MTKKINILTAIALATALAAPIEALAKDRYLPSLRREVASPLTTVPVPYGQIIRDPDTDVRFEIQHDWAPKR
jgi:hypothetical protein